MRSRARAFGGASNGVAPSSSGASETLQAHIITVALTVVSGSLEPDGATPFAKIAAVCVPVVFVWLTHTLLPVCVPSPCQVAAATAFNCLHSDLRELISDSRDLGKKLDSMTVGVSSKLDRVIVEMARQAKIQAELKDLLMGKKSAIEGVADASAAVKR